MNRIVLILLVMFATFSFSTAQAANAWYSGQVKRVALLGNDGSFLIVFKNTALDDCQYKYAYSMALTSTTAGLDMGVVIDKAINGSGGQCDVTGGMGADLRAN